MNHYLITRETIKDENFIVSALYSGEKEMLELTLVNPKEEMVLGNIYIARVEHVVSNIRAAFVKISPNRTCYLSFDDLTNAFFTKKLSSKKEIAAGEELLVQISREALKTKEPAVTANLNFSGKYAILTTAKRKNGISAKLSKNQKAHYKALLETLKNDNYGIIIRTNAQTVSDEVLLEEIHQLEKEWNIIRQTAPHKTCYSLLKEADPVYLEDIKKQQIGTLEKVITDDRSIFEKICTNFGIKQDQFQTTGAVRVPVNQFETPDGIILSYYDDCMLSLSALYSVKTFLDKALKQQVWLNSGASIIIQHTEALTVIDVNSGKNLLKKEMQDNILRINLEAAKEIAYQLRLRNISGIILIDFINLSSKEAEEKLLKKFRSFLKTDSVKTEVIDITKLGIVEVTRKKIKKSLLDSLNQKL